MYRLIIIVFVVPKRSRFLALYFIHPGHTQYLDSHRPHESIMNIEKNEKLQSEQHYEDKGS